MFELVGVTDAVMPMPEAERVLRLRLHNARTDRFVDRSAIDPARPTVRFRTDERSYLLPSRRFERPDAAVAFLGGSTTECMVVQEDLRFPARVSYLLEQKGLKVNTLNAGKAGNTTHDAINVLLNHTARTVPRHRALRPCPVRRGTPHASQHRTAHAAHASLWPLVPSAGAAGPGCPRRLVRALSGRIRAGTAARHGSPSPSGVVA